MPSNAIAMTTAIAPAIRESLGTSLCPSGDVVHDFAYHLGRAQPDEQPESGKHHRDVVHLADHGNEIGDDVERRDRVDERQHEHRLGEDRYPPVAEQPPVEPREARQVKKHLEEPPGEKVAWKRRRPQRHAPWMTGPSWLVNRTHSGSPHTLRHLSSVW